MTSQQDIKAAVSKHYAAKAQRTGGKDALLIVQSKDACCGDDCCAPAQLTDEERGFVKGLYAEAEVAGLPDAALDAAAGCGNPTAISELQQGEVVLDLGSGGGIDCFLAGKQVGPAGKVIGIDMTVEMVELARCNATEVGATNVQFKLGEIEDLPIPDASVDVVISNCAVNLSTDKPAVFAEVARVLRPGGRFRVSDIVWAKQPPADAATTESWAGCIAGALEINDFLKGLELAGLTAARTDSVRFIDEDRGLASALISAEKPF